jgi:hypothetical protein
VVSCGFSRESLALYASGDLSSDQATAAARHLSGCDGCRQFVDELRAARAAMRSLARQPVSELDCAAMRRQVMAAIERGDAGGWAVRLERAIVLAFRPRRWATAAAVVLAALSVSLLAQMRQPPAAAMRSIAVVEGTDTLYRPAGYRDWVLVGSGVADSSGGAGSAGAATGGHNPDNADKVYVDPLSYREFARSGRFPEGTLMVWESGGGEAAARPHKNSPQLLASLKDSRRFDGGWGFFDFTGSDGAMSAKARALPASSGCRACHQHGARFLAYRG